ncbi:hypothetical protein KDA_01840 [Dictyobacter alpinus]|uniref:Uncharacterized protein n=1 Tax=Dictyobacter alpinus TaxID=2014873 RepID=A0A402B032_9CHLR|nr:hypothetical protein KDA_01840 [Dictyobacter alpinus]
MLIGTDTEPKLTEVKITAISTITRLLNTNRGKTRRGDDGTGAGAAEVGRVTIFITKLLTLIYRARRRAMAWISHLEENIERHAHNGPGSLL